MQLPAILLRTLLIFALATNAFASPAHAHAEGVMRQSGIAGVADVPCHHQHHATVGVVEMAAVHPGTSPSETQPAAETREPAHAGGKCCCGGGTCHCLCAHAAQALMVAYLPLFIPNMHANVATAHLGTLRHLDRVPLLRPPIA